MNQNLDGIGLRNERPWGAWTVLETGPGYKVKRLEVLPGKRLSLQKHFHRSEHWVVVKMFLETGSSKVDSARFIEVAYGSLLECVSELEIAKRQKFLTKEMFEAAYSKAEDLAKMLSGFRRNLKKRS